MKDDDELDNVDDFFSHAGDEHYDRSKSANRNFLYQTEQTTNRRRSTRRSISKSPQPPKNTTTPETTRAKSKSPRTSNVKSSSPPDDQESERLNPAWKYTEDDVDDVKVMSHADDIASMKFSFGSEDPVESEPLETCHDDETFAEDVKEDPFVSESLNTKSNKRSSPLKDGKDESSKKSKKQSTVKKNAPRSRKVVKEKALTDSKEGTTTISDEIPESSSKEPKTRQTTKKQPSKSRKRQSPETNDTQHQDETISDGVRRSRRTKIKTLSFWANERVEYDWNNAGK